MAEDAEITTEVNPGTADREKLAAWRQAGINRLSFGLQSTENRELQYLGRIHTMEDFLESYRDAREAGFENINIDLMSALPGQTVSSWEKTLRTVVSLQPEHISAYSLIIEEGTPFCQLFGEDGDAEEEKNAASPLAFLSFRTRTRSAECTMIQNGFWEKPDTIGTRFPIMRSRDMSAAIIKVTGLEPSIWAWGWEPPPISI
ncbi:MAG: radical SAM protein [Clostridium sp.]